MHIMRSVVLVALVNAGLAGCGGGGGGNGGGGALATVSPGGTSGGTDGGTTLSNTDNSTEQNTSAQSTSTSVVGAGGAQLPGAVMIATRGRGLETGSVDSAGRVTLDHGGPDASVTVQSVNAETLTLPDGRQVALTASGSNGDGSRRYSGTLAGGGTVVLASYQTPGSLSYSDYGSWAVSDGSSVGLAVYALGSATPTTQMPITGSASYLGAAVGAASIGGTGYSFKGSTALTANFATGGIAGQLTGLQATTSGGVAAGRLNNIVLTGAIAGNGFAGAVAPGAADGSTTLDISGTSGTFGGSFNGPAAQEVAGTFRMEGGGDSIAGAFGAHQ